MVMVLSRILLALCFASAADSKSLISEECGETNLKRMYQCAEGGRNEIVWLTSFKCYEIGKRGPCSDGDVLVLNKDSDCWAPHCIYNGGCEEEDFLYEGECYNSSSARIPCERKGHKNHLLVADSFGNLTCQAPDLGIRGVFDLDADDSSTNVSGQKDIPKDVELGGIIKQETIAGDMSALQRKLCSIHCNRNLGSFDQCSCDGRPRRDLEKIGPELG